jgi:hypothetical protein
MNQLLSTFEDNMKRKNKGEEKKKGQTVQENNV